MGELEFCIFSKDNYVLINIFFSSFSVSGPGWPYATDVYTFGGPSVTRPITLFNEALASTDRPWDDSGPSSVLHFTWEGVWDANNGTFANLGGTFSHLSVRTGFQTTVNITFAVPDPGPGASASGRPLFLVLRVFRPASMLPTTAVYTEDRLFVKIQR